MAIGDASMAQQPIATDPVFIAGQVHALVTFAQVLASLHPDRDALLVHFSAAEQIGLAKVENQLASPFLVKGYQDAIDHIRRAIERPTENY
jgi:hypothetical protein